MTESGSEIIAGLMVSRKRNGRCVYDPQAKNALVEACLRPSVSVAGMALRHGVNANLLRKWIRQHQRKQGMVLPGAATRTMVLSRKNFLFAGADSGGERAAVLYTLLETAKLNDLDPEAYLRFVLERIAAQPSNRLAELLPWSFAPQCARHEQLAA